MSRDGTANRNLRWAATLMGALADRGVTDVVISPGSRSTPLVLACEATQGLTLRVQVDERAAAFFALGLAKGTGRPAALICTSGSAPAHWLPAVIEARSAGVPLLLLSADRPPELHDCGANQTIDQTRLFGAHVNGFHAFPPPDDDVLEVMPAMAARILDQTLWPEPGPVHVNLPFREPLVPQVVPPSGGRPDHLAQAPMPMHPSAACPVPEAAELAERIAGHPGVIVCGSTSQHGGYPAAVAELAAVLRVPILADPLSGLRFGPHDRAQVLARYDAFLRGAASWVGYKPDWVLNLGGPPVSKLLLSWLEPRGSEDFIVVEPGGRWPDPLRKATRMVRADPTQLCSALADEAPALAPSGWLEHFLEAEKAAEAIDSSGIPEARVVQTLADTLPPGSTLFVGNSLPVREVDWFSGTGSHTVRLLGNRGASGIDGHLSTVLGLAASGEGPVVGLIGDLAFFHDMNGLAMARDSGIDATIIVLENGGGGIFGYLPQAGLDGFAEHWLTPTGIDIGRAATLFGVRHRKVSPDGTFATVLSESLETPGVDLIEVSIDREQSVAAHRAWWDAVAEALEETA